MGFAGTGRTVEQQAPFEMLTRSEQLRCPSADVDGVAFDRRQHPVGQDHVVRGGGRALPKGDGRLTVFVDPERQHLTSVDVEPAPQRLDLIQYRGGRLLVGREHLQSGVLVLVPPLRFDAYRGGPTLVMDQPDAHGHAAKGLFPAHRVFLVGGWADLGGAVEPSGQYGGEGECGIVQQLGAEAETVGVRIAGCQMFHGQLEVWPVDRRHLLTDRCHIGRINAEVGHHPFPSLAAAGRLKPVNLLHEPRERGGEPAQFLVVKYWLGFVRAAHRPRLVG